MFIYNEIELNHGTFYWLMGTDGITIGEFHEDFGNLFTVIGEEEMYPPSNWKIIKPVCLEHVTKFPSLDKE
jgi:hypothetical protein